MSKTTSAITGTKKSAANAPKNLAEAGVPPEADIFAISCDYSDVEELVLELKRTLPKLGIDIVDDPRYEGTDSVGFLLSKTSLTPKRVKAYVDDMDM